VLRDGRRLFLNANIADPFESFVAGRTIDDELRGARLTDVIDDSNFGSNPGILVGPVEEDSNAWNNGLRQGDVVFQVNRQRVRNMKQLKAAIGRSIVHVKLRRDSRLVTLVAR
jgi:S1-C subfamily serine protease